MKQDSTPVDVRVKELETTVDEVQSKLTMKLTEMEKLKNENKSLTTKYVQLKSKLNLNEHDSATVSQSITLDSLEQDPEVRDNYTYVYNYYVFM